jgi:hypothetical protein
VTRKTLAARRKRQSRPFAQRDPGEFDNQVVAEASIDGIAFRDGKASTGGAFRLLEPRRSWELERVDPLERRGARPGAKSSSHGTNEVARTNSHLTMH